MKLESIKKLSAVIFFTVLILSLNVIKAQNQFEGKLKFKIQDENGKANYITYYTQNGNMRMDFPNSAKGGYMIVKNKSMYIVIPAQKMYIEYSAGMKELMNSFSAPAKTTGKQKETDTKTNWEEIFNKAKTGNTKTILGHLCDEFVMPGNDGGSTHIWVTKDLGNIVFMQNPMRRNPFLDNVKKMGAYFPLLIEAIDAKGKVISKFEVVEINKEKLDGNLFDVPQNYKKMSIPGMK